MKRINIGIDIVVIAFIGVFVLSACQSSESEEEMKRLSGGTTFESEEEMKQAVRGYYSWEGNVNGEEQDYLFVNTELNKITYRTYLNSTSRLPSDYECDIENWDPHSGTFSLEEITYKVTDDGSLKTMNSDDIYYRTTVQDYKHMNNNPLNRNNTTQESYDQKEDGNDVLEITVNMLNDNSSYTYCTGTVKNTGKKTYRYIRVKGAFKNKNGEVIDTDSAYAVGSEGLEPGESSSFRISVPKNYDIKSVSVTLLGFE